MRQIRNTSVMEVLSEEARAFGIKRLAPELDKEPSTLYAELNPYGDQSKAKLSFDDAVEIMRLIRSVTALELASSSLGFRLVRVDAVPDKPTVAEELADDTQNLGVWANICMDACATEKEVELAAAALHKNVEETKAIKLADIAAKRLVP